ncbi:MAG: class D sortase [Oscillospiraceae bacterium]|jgi:sortase A|nr:class D sortase [Oscillospiraceae bacterium]
MQRARHGPSTLFAYPVVFVLLTFLLLYGALILFGKPFLSIPGLFISGDGQTRQISRDLFSSRETVAPVASADEPVNAGIPESGIVMPDCGDLYGRLTISGTEIDAPVYWNDSSRELNAGVGTYTGGWLPGFGRTILLAGHRDTYLKDLRSAETGAVITVETHYGVYTYEVSGTAVYHMSDSSAYDFSREDENIIIYTCYPFDYIGAAKQRYFVYGIPLSGAAVDKYS